MESENMFLDHINSIAVAMGSIVAISTAIVACRKKIRILIIATFVTPQIEQKMKEVKTEVFDEMKEQYDSMQMQFDRQNELFEKITDSLATVQEGQKYQMSNFISNIYTKCLPTKTIRQRDKHAIEDYYDHYHNKLHGNSWISSIYEQLEKFEVIPDYTSKLKEDKGE